MRLLELADGDYDRDCVLYLRKSKGKAGIARQRRQSEEHARQRRWRIVAEFEDADTTAFKHVLAHEHARRDDYEAMLEFLRADTREVPVGVLGWHADRLHRDVVEAKGFIKICAAGRHPVETPMSGGYDLTTATGRKRFLSDAVDAEFEVDHQSERRAEGKRDSALQGRWLGGPVPFGYRAVRPDDEEFRVLVVHEPEAELLREVYDAVLRLQETANLEEFARKWNKLGLRKPQSGKPWAGSDISRILRRPRYAGLMEFQGAVIETLRPDKKAEWTPIVSEDLWRAAVRILRAGKGRPRGPYARHFGSGLYVCGAPVGPDGEICGLTVKGGPSQNGTPLPTGERPKTRVYRCKARGPGHVARNADNVDALVEATLLARLSRPDVRRVLASLEPPDVSEIRARMKAEEDVLEEWKESAKLPGASPAVIVAGEAAARARLEELKAEYAEARMIQSPVLAEIIESDDVHALWDSKEDDLAWRRAALDLFVTVVILPTGAGRPAGVPARDGWFDADAIDFRWKDLSAPAVSAPAG